MDVSLGYENMNSFPDVKAEKKRKDRVRLYRKILFISAGLIQFRKGPCFGWAYIRREFISLKTKFETLTLTVTGAYQNKIRLESQFFFTRLI